MGSSLESHIAECWHDGDILSALVIQTQYMIHLITQQWWCQEHLLFNHSLIQIMVPVCHVQMGLTGVRAPVWTANGMRHWKRLIKISGDTDCYYCINNMPCSLHMYYCSVIHCYIPWYSIHQHVTCISCISCGNTLFMCIYNLHSMYSVSCVPRRYC